jgi:predicted NAD-dependent protein-ADP-ribosyltransferase YbiA (DUF1768 family)
MAETVAFANTAAAANPFNMFNTAAPTAPTNPFNAFNVSAPLAAPSIPSVTLAPSAPTLQQTPLIPIMEDVSGARADLDAIEANKNYKLPDTYDPTTKAAIFAFFKKRSKNAVDYTFTKDGNLETKEGAKVSARAKAEAAGTILLKRFVPMDATERKILEEMRLDAMAKIQDDIEEQRAALTEALDLYRQTGELQGVLMANKKMADLDKLLSVTRSASRNIIDIPNPVTRDILFKERYEVRKMVHMGKDPFQKNLYRLALYDFQQEHELGKYVADEVLAAEGVAEADKDIATGSSELANRQKMKDGQYARVFFEPSDTDPNAVLSPLYPVSFTYENRKFASAYQAYEVMRAEELGKPDIVQKLLGTTSSRTMRVITADKKGSPPMGHPADAMTLWKNILTAVYTQHPPLQQYLINTGKDRLIYADPRVGPSGIGLGEKDGGVLDSSRWKGENKVGIVLETIRNQMLENTLVDSGVEEATEGGVITVEEQQRAKVGAIINARRRGG